MSRPKPQIPHVTISTYLPFPLLQQLEDLAHERRVPRSKLICDLIAAGLAATASAPDEAQKQ